MQTAHKLKTIKQLRENQPYRGLLLECIPNPVIFEYYEEFGKYEMTLEVLNRSAIPTAIRQKANSTKYFKVRRVDACEGKIAPGLTAKFIVSFSPDSLLDFTDEITFISASKDEVVLQLLGRRKRPLLTLPRIINLGYCFNGTEISKQIVCKNQGGKGKFIFQHEYSDQTNIKFLFSTLNEFEKDVDIVEKSPFYISPKYFSLNEGEEALLTVAFRPEIVGEQSQSIFIIFDNEQVFEIKLVAEAQYPRIDLCSISKRRNFIATRDSTLLCFETVYPYQKSEPQLLTHFNNSDVPVEFEWRYINEYTDVPISSNGINLPFMIQPSVGRIKPRSCMAFEVTFTPQSLGIFSGYFLLFVNNVPLPVSTDHPYFYYFKSGFSWFRDSILNSLKTSDPLRYFTPYSSEVVEIENESKTTALGESNLVCFGSIPVFHCRLYGDTQKLDVFLNPPIINLSNSIYIGEVVEKQVTIVNNSDFDAYFRWLICEEDDGVKTEFEPSSGSIGPKEKFLTKLFISCTKPQAFNISCICEIANSEEIELLLRGEVKPQTLRIDTPCLDLGIVESGKSVSDCVQITNTSSLDLNWTCSTAEDDAVEIIPIDGCLPVGKSCLVNVTVQSTIPRIIHQRLRFDVENGISQFVGLDAEIQSAKVILEECFFNLGELSVGEVVTRTIKMKSVSSITTDFCWYDLNLIEDRPYEVEFINEKGKLKLGEEAETIIEIRATAIATMFEEVFPCFLQDSKDNYFGIKIVGSIKEENTLD